jgi:ribonuclease-3
MASEARNAVEQLLGYQFRNAELLELALRHSSVADARVRSNERLEFLGDAVLGVITCDQVFRSYPDLLEGEMTKIKSSVVSRQSCAAIAKQIGLVQYLELGKGMRSNGHLPVSLGAAILESVIGALYLDGGLAVVERFLIPLIKPRIEAAFGSGHQENYKSLVQQHAQQGGLSQPTYVIMSQTGPDHSKTFEICVQMGERRFGTATGQSKKAAEQAAAMKALQELGLLDEHGVVKPIARTPEPTEASDGLTAPQGEQAVAPAAELAGQ